MRYHTPIKMAIIKKKKKVLARTWRNNPFDDRNTKWYGCCGNSLVVPQNLTQLQDEPAILFLDIYPKKLKGVRYLHTMFTVTLFRIAKR